MQGQDYQLGPYVNPIHHYALLGTVLDLHHPPGVAVEFGVGSGKSARVITERMPVIGFDSFGGLPEDWREGFPAGSFAQDDIPVIDGAEWVIGLFEETCRGQWDGPDIGLVHIDCDLYSSTALALAHVEAALIESPGTIIVFDEWHGYAGCEDFEQRAWREFASRTGISWTVLGHSHEGWSIRVE